MFFIHSQMTRGQMLFAPQSCESINLAFPRDLPKIILTTIVCKAHGRNFSGVYA